MSNDPIRPRALHHGTVEGSRSRRTVRPIASEPTKIDLSGMIPPNLYCPNASKPTEAMQPHCVQSGSPPYWHGVIGFFRSAETHAVVFEKMHSSGILRRTEVPAHDGRNHVAQFGLARVQRL